MPPAETPAAPPTNVRWSVFALACATSGLLYLHRYVFGFIKPQLAREWELSNSELGAIDSAFSVCYTAFQFPFAVLADVLGVHLVLTGLTLIWLGGLATMAWAPSAGWMWCGQATLGTGQSAVYACLNRVARLWFPPDVRTTLQGAVGILAGRLGALSSSLVFTSLLLGAWGLDWRTAVWLLVALGGAQLVLFAVVFRNSPRQHPRVNAAEAELIAGDAAAAASPPPARMTLRQMFSGMTPRAVWNLLFLSVQSTLSTFADNVFSHWIPLFLVQVHQLQFKEMGVFSALPLLGGALAGVVGGGLNDWLIARTGNRRWSRIGVALAGKGLGAVLLLGALSDYQRPYAFCVWLFFVKFFGDWSLTTAWGVVTDIGGRATATVFAFQNTVAGVSMITAPLVFGYLSEHAGWPAVFVTVAATYAVCALSWLLIDCTLPVLQEGEPGAASS